MASETKGDAPGGPRGAVGGARSETGVGDAAARPGGATGAESGSASGRPRGAVGRLLAFAGPRRKLTYLGCALSAVSMLVSFGPYVCIWFASRDLIAVAPDWGAAAGIAAYGWWALAFAVGSIALYFAGLMCTHLAAFRCASNMRKRTTGHLMHTSLGYFDTHATGGWASRASCRSP